MDNAQLQAKIDEHRQVIANLQQQQQLLVQRQGEVQQEILRRDGAVLQLQELMTVPTTIEQPKEVDAREQVAP